MAKPRKSSTTQKKIIRHSTSASSLGLSQPTQGRQSAPIDDRRPSVPPIVPTTSPINVATPFDRSDSSIVVGSKHEGREEDANEHEVRADTMKVHSQLPSTQTQSSSGLSFKPAFLRRSDVTVDTQRQREDILEIDESTRGNSAHNFGMQALSSNDNNNDITALFGTPNANKLSHPTVSSSYSPARQKGGKRSFKYDNMNSRSGTLQKVLKGLKTDQTWMMNIGKIHDKRAVQGTYGSYMNNFQYSSVLSY